MEQVTLVKQGHMECLGSHSEDSRLKFRPSEMLGKKVLKPL